MLFATLLVLFVLYFLSLSFYFIHSVFHAFSMCIMCSLLSIRGSGSINIIIIIYYFPFNWYFNILRYRKPKNDTKKKEISLSTKIVMRRPVKAHGQLHVLMQDQWFHIHTDQHVMNHSQQCTICIPATYSNTYQSRAHDTWRSWWMEKNSTFFRSAYNYFDIVSSYGSILPNINCVYVHEYFHVIFAGRSLTMKRTKRKEVKRKNWL